MKEEWKDIPGYEGEYQASNLGRIKALNFKGKGEERLLTIGHNAYGYEQACLWGKPRLVHRLVAQTFIPNPKGYPIINHKDEDKTNNCVDNLEWCTYKYNANYGTAIERSVESRKRPVVAVTKNGDVEFYTCAKEASEKLYVPIDCIYRALKRRTKTSAKRTWFYQEDLLRR